MTSLHGFVKTILVAGTKKLPVRLRELLMRTLIRQSGEDALLGRMAMEAGITGFIASGSSGSIQSTSADRKILLEYARTGSWAERTNRTFVEFFARRSGTYLDIGANIGLTTLPVAENPHVRCLAFEPEPANFANLADNVRRNARHGNVELYQVALYDREGTVALGLAMDGNLGDHRVMAEGQNRGRTIDVRSARLDDVVTEFAGPLAAKIDAQGAEPYIITGGSKILARAELVVLEFSPMLIDQLGGEVAKIVEFLATFDRLEMVRGDSLEALTPISPSDIGPRLMQIFERGRTDDRYYFDVYAQREPLARLPEATPY